MKILRYQQKAVKEIVDKIISLLENSEYEQNLVFKAPTGSGKTIMATQVLADLSEELLIRPDCSYNQVAFVWIAPQKLHLQSFEKLKAIFAENHKLTPVLFDDIDQTEGYIKPNEILFVNWESVNKDSNLMVQERENADSFFEIIDRTQQEQGRPVVLIIDEEHRNWSKNADKSLQVVQRIHPKVEFRISATPRTSSFNTVTIQRHEVVAEEMIKKGILLNEDIEVNEQDPELNLYLLRKALEMRQKLADEYKRLKVDINPLLLIQLPNDTTETLSSEEKALSDTLIQILDVKYGITEANGRLGIWLSGRKTIGDEISQNNDLTQVLLFKQAIALGWDCPRAAVLLIFRNLKSEVFTVQTLGRIMRMPEQKFYPSELLNIGHVYTDISRESIKIAIEDSNYIRKDDLIARRRDKLHNISLDSVHRERKSEDRNRLGSNFRQILLNQFAAFLKLKQENLMFSIAEMENWEERDSDELGLLGTSVGKNRQRAVELGLNLNVKTINVAIPRHLFFQNEVGEVVSFETCKYARSMGEIERVYMAFCRRMVIHGNFEAKTSTEKLAGCLKEITGELFGCLEEEVPKIVLSNDRSHHNRPKFEGIIQRALAECAKDREERLKKARQRELKRSLWEVPEVRYYPVDTHHLVSDVKNHALMPFVELNKVSAPEVEFAKFIEGYTNVIDWWYKNGDEGILNYAIPYTNALGEPTPFYVDFIIRMKNGKIFLFDTKDKNSDSEAPNKHNALLDYMAEENKKGKNLDGGVLIFSDDQWKYSSFKIDNTTDLKGWKDFYPDQYK